MTSLRKREKPQIESQFRYMFCFPYYQRPSKGDLNSRVSLKDLSSCFKLTFGIPRPNVLCLMEIDIKMYVFDP